jgi:hypothetical protein
LRGSSSCARRANPLLQFESQPSCGNPWPRVAARNTFLASMDHPIRWPRGNPQARSRPIVEGCMADGSFHCGALRQLSSNIAMPEAGVVHPFRVFTLFRGDLRRHAEDCLRLQEFVKGMVAPFAAVAGGLVAAEGRHQVHRRAVEAHLAGAQAGRDLARFH